MFKLDEGNDIDGKDNPKDWEVEWEVWEVAVDKYKEKYELVRHKQKLIERNKGGGKGNKVNWGESIIEEELSKDLILNFLLIIVKISSKTYHSLSKQFFI